MTSEGSEGGLMPADDTLAGTDLEASGAVLGGGTPMADACGFPQW